MAEEKKLKKSCCLIGSKKDMRNDVLPTNKENLNTALQWLICQLHFVELPLRALFQLIDGPTAGPESFSGPIGSSLKFCNSLPIVKFRRISCNLPSFSGGFHTRDLSTDQKYLYEMCEAISCGVVSPTLAERNPGNLSHSRWLTLANNVLRKYVGTTNPSKDLRTIVTFILKAYAPSWFNIKTNNKCVDGAVNLFNFIKATRYLQTKYRLEVDDSIQRNAFYAHHENILISMLCDECKDVRELAYNRILEARTVSKSNPNIVRRLTVPEINFKARAYHQLIDWAKVDATEPPLIQKLTQNDLKLLVADGRESKIFQIDIFKLPCHTQAVERCVKLVTQASLRVADDLRRDGYIRTVYQSRAIMPQFNKKHDFRTFL